MAQSRRQPGHRCPYLRHPPPPHRRHLSHPLQRFTPSPSPSFLLPPPHSKPNSLPDISLRFFLFARSMPHSVVSLRLCAEDWRPDEWWRPRCPNPASLLERGFGAAIWMLNGIEESHFMPRLCTLSSILNWSCSFGDVKIAGLNTKEMVVRDLLPMVPAMDFDLIIRRFCELGKTFAALLIFDKAQRRSIELESASFMCLLRALAREGRTKEALKVYDIISLREVSAVPESLDIFLSGICRGREPMEEIDAVIKNVIRKGFLPNILDFSRYIAETYSRGRWKEVTEFMDVVLDEGILVDASCCCLLVKHFCNNGRVDSVIDLHERMRRLGGCLDVDSYNALLETLVVDGQWKQVEFLTI